MTPRLCEGPTYTFFAEVLKQLPRQGSEHWLIKTHSYSDSKTAEFIKAADHFIDASDWDDNTLIHKLRAMQPDILIELSGHSPHHRLRALAQRIAPVQISWLDYFNPTGISAIDGFISDSVISAGPQAGHILLPCGRLAYHPPLAAAPIQPSDTTQVRFGSFNRAAKINNSVLETWGGYSGTVSASYTDTKKQPLRTPGIPGILYRKSPAVQNCPAPPQTPGLFQPQ